MNTKQVDKRNLKGAAWLAIIAGLALIIIIVAVVLSSGSDRQSSDQPSSATPAASEVAEPLRPGRMFLELANNAPISIGDEVLVEAWLDTLGSNINLANVVIGYDSQALELVAVDGDDSALSLRARDDSTQGRADILRGAPGDGNANDSDDGFTGIGLFATFVFKALGPGSTSLELLPGEAKLLLDDGKGSLMGLSLEGVTVNVQ